MHIKLKTKRFNLSVKLNLWIIAVAPLMIL